MERFRVCFAKSGMLKYISHLDLQRTFLRALRRAKIPLAYSQGFSPQPRVVFAAPLGIGIEGINEYLDLFLTRQMQMELLEKRINRQLPMGLIVKNICSISLEEPAISALIGAALYRARLEMDPGSLQQNIGNLLSAEQLPKERQHKKGKKQVDIRPFILDLWEEEIGGSRNLFMLLVTGSSGGARPEEILELLQLPELRKGTILTRESLFFRVGEKLLTPGGAAYNNINEVKAWREKLL